MNTKKKLAIFDLDGTLFDTSLVNYHAYREALVPYGVELDEAYFTTYCNGRHYTEFLPEIMKTTAYLKDVHVAKKDAYARNLDKARANTFLLDMIRGIRESYHIAIVTTASRQNTMDILSHFDCVDLFELIITQENITRVKPDPEGFLIAMENFQTEPASTVIFEDSQVGITAARATGAAVMIVDRF